MIELKTFRFESAIFFLFLLVTFSADAAKQTKLFWTVDSTRNASIEDMIDAPFEQVLAVVPNFSVSSYPQWIRIDIDDVDEDEYLAIENATIDLIEIYQYSNGVRLMNKRSGEILGFDERDLPIAVFAFKLVEIDEACSLFLKLESGKQLMFPFKILSKDELLEKQSTKDIFYSIYAGIFLAMLLYNLFIWFTVRDKNYLFYVFYIFFVGLTQLVLNGYGNQFFWPSSTWLAIRATHFSGILSGSATVLFALNYLQTKKYTPTIHKIVLGFTLIYFFAAVLTFLGYFVVAFNLINLSALAAFLLLIAAYKGMKSGYRPASYFLVAFSIFIVGVMVFALKDFGVLPYNNITLYALPVGSALEVVLLSFALADRINQLKREKELEQEEKLFALSENERIIKQQNATLETRVNERTKELARANEELSHTLSNLKSAQAQLVDAEKMASLGQMTAGIAHELNNPINFVSGNITPLKRDIDDIFQVIDNLEGIMPDDAEIHEKVRNIQQLSKDLELPFIRSEIGQLLRGIEDGANRTSAIVRGLRVFSRLDEDALKKADINECLISTLIILKSNMRGEATIIEDLDPNMKEINCFPGKLNQVFMNIINNAVQATAGLGRTREERKIWISTKYDTSQVTVRIKDNGVGIPDSVKQRIFDPFFTTKEVGEGTGLGLSIVLGIVNDHNGKIEVDSQEGVGTEFIITLPSSH
jgi:two-component system, NtrC family, sensor kinase